MKRIYTYLLLLISLGVVQQANAANANVNVADFTFSPAAVTINQGESVTWHWVNGTHTIHSDSSPQAWTEAISSSSSPTFSHTFNAPGSYPYHCTIHGSVMSGTITVLAAPTGTKDELTKNVLMVYPNPAKDFLNISLTSGNYANYEVKITNAIGKTVKTVSNAEIKVKADNKIVLSISDLAPGLYFVSLWNKERILETKRQVIFK